MFKKTSAQRPLALVMAALLLSGCAVTGLDPDIAPRPASTPMPDAPQGAEQGGDLTYVGDLPPSVPAFDAQHKTDALGEPQFISMQSAVSAYGEKRVRRAIVRTVSLCYKVEVQKWATAEARRQADWVVKAQAATRKAIKRGETVNDVLSLGSVGVGFAVSPPTPLYGVLNGIGAVQGWNSNHMWSLAMDQTDRENDLNLVLVNLFLGNEDLYLDSMQEWCSRFEGFVSQHGTFARDTNHAPTFIDPPADTRNH